MVEEIINSIIVEGEIADIFKLWSNFEDFPKFMRNIKSVKKTSPNESHWVMEGPMGKDLEWDAKITRFEENKRIAWSSTGGDVKTSGQVTFNGLPDHKTEATLILHYSNPPGGKAG